MSDFSYWISLPVKLGSIPKRIRNDILTAGDCIKVNFILDP